MDVLRLIIFQREVKEKNLNKNHLKTGERYAKCNKPGSKRQIPYDLTFKWNLINKTNKEAKYNQRH